MLTVARSLAAFAAASTLVVSSALDAQVLPHAPVVDHLANGLTVITVPYDSPGVVAYFQLRRTVARWEVEGTPASRKGGVTSPAEATL